MAIKAGALILENAADRAPQFSNVNPQFLPGHVLARNLYPSARSRPVLLRSLSQKLHRVSDACGFQRARERRRTRPTRKSSANSDLRPLDTRQGRDSTPTKSVADVSSPGRLSLSLSLCVARNVVKKEQGKTRKRRAAGGKFRRARATYTTSHS